ncbi:MAG: serine--tRNA ligase, partial [Flavobacteriales bacterium]|nr:serine--tRNA ligase [Flavobacteriales bacterium]
MLQVPYIQENWEASVAGLKKRGLKNAEEQLQKLVELNDLRKSAQQTLDEVLAESNQLAKQIGQLFKEGKQEEANAAKKKTTELKAASKELGEKLQTVEADLLDLLYQIPNIPNDLVPDGQSDEDNQVVKEGEIAKPSLHEKAKPHWELIQDYDLIDFELGVKITGAGFPVYKGKGARLVRG